MVLKESFNTEKFKDFGSFKPDNNLEKVTNNSNLYAEIMIQKIKDKKMNKI